MLREGARPEIVRDNMGHANIDVTRNVYSKSWPVAHSSRLEWAPPLTAMSAKGPALKAREGQGTRFFWC